MPAELVELFRPVFEHWTAFRAEARVGEPSFREEEVRMSELMANAEAGAVGSMLASLDPEAPVVEMGGRQYKRMNLETSELYHTRVGSVRVQRGLYRELGVRNGPTIVPMELRAGIVEGRYTPGAARAIAVLAQALPSREADLVSQELQVLPHSRSSQHRAGISVGGRCRTSDGTPLALPIQVPDTAASVSVSADRVSMPMAEPRPPTPDDLEAGVKRPITVALRMAYAGALTFHDRSGDALESIRFAHVPSQGKQALQDELKTALSEVIDLRPELHIVALSDGAPEMQAIVDYATQGYANVERRTDFWHLTEHLADALRDTGRHVDDRLGDWKGELLASDDAIGPIAEQLRGWAAEYAPDRPPDGLHDALTFIENRRDRLRYASARAAGRPIGSGNVEATCKTIVSTRMKRPGARWTEDGAQPILDLRALATSSPRRWKAALDSILDSYTEIVTPIP